jgi:hypothetical protein
MTKAPISLQDLRRRIYVKAKAEPTWRFWGLYVHVCKLETLHAAYALAKSNHGAPGVDGVTFEAIEAHGVGSFLEQIRHDLVERTYRPQRVRKVEISARSFSYIRDWVEKKIRRHLARACKRRGFGWKRWSRSWLYETLGLFNDYRVRYIGTQSRSNPIGPITLEVK